MNKARWSDATLFWVLLDFLSAGRPTALTRQSITQGIHLIGMRWNIPGVTPQKNSLALIIAFLFVIFRDNFKFLEN
jgi:hypothetical protein